MKHCFAIANDMKYSGEIRQAAVEQIKFFDLPLAKRLQSAAVRNGDWNANDKL